MVRRIASVFALLLLVMAFTANAQEKAKALPPHPLDSAFQRGTSANDLTNGLLNNQLFKQAVAAAAKAKQDRLAEMQRNKGMVGPTPEQAARQAFLNTLTQAGVGAGADAKEKNH